MGTQIRMVESTILIPNNKKRECLEAINALQTAEGMEQHDACGGSWDGKKRTGRWYAWAGTGQSDSLDKAIELWRFSVSQTRKGLKITDFAYGRWDKMGQEDVLFNAIAPFVSNGQISFETRNGEEIVYLFKDGQVLNGVLT